MSTGGELSLALHALCSDKSLWHGEELADLVSAELQTSDGDRWRRLRAQVWKELHSRPVGGLDPGRELDLRLAYSIVCGLIALDAIHGGDDDDLDARDRGAQRLRAVDEALLVGHPRARKLLLRTVPVIASSSKEQGGEQCPRATMDLASPRSYADVDSVPWRHEKVRRVEAPSLAAFLERFFGTQPVILAGVASTWPAITKWRNAKFWLEQHGCRWVPVERGRSYLDPSFHPELMPLRDFILQFLASTDKDGVDAPSRATDNPSRQGGYLAQHQIFDQIPALRRDIIEPDYVALSESREEPVVNLWLGPKNTISPLHYDPQHNLLAQVFGSKSIVLYPPQETDRLYPHAQAPFTNTSQVDLERAHVSEQQQRFPRFRDARGFHALLEQGDILYIPPQWWHHVKSRETSCSVSFWFT